MPLPQSVPQDQLFSTTYPFANPNKPKALYNDMLGVPGGTPFTSLLNNNGTGTTNATVGTTTAITHGLGFVPNFITLTPTSNGVIYLDPANPPTATTFNVLGSAASLNFNWKAE